jgi:predicted nucleotidyltransferase
MHPHHQAAIERVTEQLRGDPEVQALLLGGSIAHGFEGPGSDVDLLIVVSDADHAARLREGRVQFATTEGCDWPGGYVEGKYVGPAFLESVARSGSEPARFAFQDARVLFSRIEGLDATLQAISRYPVEEKGERIRRFHAQFEAWHWYAHEALKLGDRYLLGMSVARTVLFGGRMILAWNELLYPYHKWFLRVLASAVDRPPDLLDRIAAVHADPSQANLLQLWATVKNFRTWEGADQSWAAQFMRDSELNWLAGDPPVDDL